MLLLLPCILYKILYVYYESRLSQQTHTHWGMNFLSCSVWQHLSLSSPARSYHCCDFLSPIERCFVARKNVIVIPPWLSIAPPILLLAKSIKLCVHPLMRSSVQIHIYASWSQYAILCCCCIFHFCMIAGRMYWIPEKNLCCYYLGIFLSLVKCDFFLRGRGKASQRFFPATVLLLIFS